VVPREHPSPTRIVPPGRTRAAAGPLARGYAFVVVSLRYLIIGGWVAAVAAAIVFLPPLNASTGGLSELIPPGSPAAHAESDAAALFAVRSLLVPALVVLFGRLGMWPRSVINPRT